MIAQRIPPKAGRKGVLELNLLSVAFAVHLHPRASLFQWVIIKVSSGGKKGLILE
jgi:hypothetical protein